MPWLTLAVFVALPAATRPARLRARIAEDGPQHAEHEAFMAWAARYDDGDVAMRSRVLHAAWIATLPCPVLRLEGDLTNAERRGRVDPLLRA